MRVHLDVKLEESPLEVQVIFEVYGISEDLINITRIRSLCNNLYYNRVKSLTRNILGRYKHHLTFTKHYLTSDSLPSGYLTHKFYYKKLNLDKDYSDIIHEISYLFRTRLLIVTDNNCKNCIYMGKKNSKYVCNRELKLHTIDNTKWVEYKKLYMPKLIKRGILDSNGNFKKGYLDRPIFLRGGFIYDCKWFTKKSPYGSGEYGHTYLTLLSKVVEKAKDNIDLNFCMLYTLKEYIISLREFDGIFMVSSPDNASRICLSVVTADPELTYKPRIYMEFSSGEFLFTFCRFSDNGTKYRTLNIDKIISKCKHFVSSISSVSLDVEKERCRLLDYLKSDPGISLSGLSDNALLLYYRKRGRTRLKEKEFAKVAKKSLELITNRLKETGRYVEIISSEPHNDKDLLIKLNQNVAELKPDLSIESGNVESTTVNTINVQIKKTAVTATQNSP